MKNLPLFLIATLLFASCAKKSKNNSFFIFEPDVRLFTAYSFMNAAGYDHDWMEEMHPIRTEVREYLDSVLSPTYKEELKECYNQLGGGNFYAFGASALHLGNPPKFIFSDDVWDFEYLEKFSEYDSMLREFYTKANIEKLWDKYESQLSELNCSYKPFAEIALKQITDYCRVDSNFYGNFANNIHYQEIPLMSHWTAYFCEIDNDYWIIRGPGTGEPGPGGFYHEALHKIINPIVESNQDINLKITPLVSYAQERLGGAYSSEIGILCESFVRTIDRILTASYYENSEEELFKQIENEYKLGHILCKYLHENLPLFETSDLTLGEYYSVLIDGIDIDHEINRWESYWQTNNE